MEGRAPPVAIPAQDSASCIRSIKEGPNGMREAEESKGRLELERWVGEWGRARQETGGIKRLPPSHGRATRPAVTPWSRLMKPMRTGYYINTMTPRNQMR